MQKKIHACLPKLQQRAFAVVLAALLGPPSFAQLTFHAETGVVFTERNDIRRGSSGDQISLRTDLKTPPLPFLRLRLSYTLQEKNFFSLLYAPFKYAVSGTLEKEIRFGDYIFAANEPLEAVYQFNSYRFTYNRRIVNREKLTLGLGLSAKVREAGFTLENSTAKRGSFGFGFVPLINVCAEWNVANHWRVEFFADGLIARRGRAVDLSLSAYYRFRKKWQAFVGYRILDGGSDGTSQYNFIRAHFSTVGLAFSIPN